jgi:hypothetical protein
MKSCQRTPCPDYQSSRDQQNQQQQLFTTTMTTIKQQLLMDKMLATITAADQTKCQQHQQQVY